jgi:hypothetical protein
MMTDRRLPLHIGTFLGVSAGAYALSLVAVTAFQARSDSAVIAARAPTVQVLAELDAKNESLLDDARRARLTYEQAMTTYQRMGTTLTDVDGELAKLAKTVENVDGLARALPDHVALPAISRTVSTVSAPAVHATTGASGG